jgi:prepilin-type N-terminal cleavage/methylation domain-containing protein
MAWREIRRLRRALYGFTLLELMVVCAILGLLSAVAIPYFSLNNAKARRAEMLTGASAIYTAEVAYFSTAGVFTENCVPYPACSCNGAGWGNPSTWTSSIAVAGSSLDNAKSYKFCIGVPKFGSGSQATFELRGYGNIDRDPTMDLGQTTELSKELILLSDDIAN